MNSYTYGDRQLWSIYTVSSGITVIIRKGSPSAIVRTVRRLAKRAPAVCAEEKVHIHWRSIQRITAFKRDQFTVDLICFQLDLEGGEPIELDEDMKGWTEFVRELSTRLPGFKSDWFATVAHRAFAENATVLFERPWVPASRMRE
jgi:hypothetical protein